MTRWVLGDRSDSNWESNMYFYIYLMTRIRSVEKWPRRDTVIFGEKARLVALSLSRFIFKDICESIFWDVVSKTQNIPLRNGNEFGNIVESK